MNKMTTKPERPAGPRPRLAIISTYDDLCGIAGYTRALVKYLSADFDIEVFDLDQYLMRHTHKRVIAMGDAHIKAFATRLGEFDFVNIQLEHGTLGRTVQQITRRLNWLVKAAPGVSVTMHTILHNRPIAWDKVMAAIGKLRFGRAVEIMFGGTRDNVLAWRTYRLLRKAQKRRPVRIITHTRRDMRLLRDVHRFKEVYDHPLAFISAADAAAVRASTSRADFPLLRTLPADAKLIGTFGFLSEYKGFEVAIKALRQLPQDHHLLIFGGTHPQSIQPFQTIDPYVKTLLATGRIDQSIFDELGTTRQSVSLSLDGDSMRDMLTRFPLDLSERIHFMGALTDDQFMRAMTVCDCVVLPYLEVGQSASGPISMALDMGCRVIASRTAAFLQFKRYFPEHFEMFDIGNFHELANRIWAGSATEAHHPARSYDTETNRAIYVTANTPPSGGLFRRLITRKKPVAAMEAS